MAKDQRAIEITEDLKNVMGVMNGRYPNFVRGETIYKAMLGVNTEYTKQRLIRDLSYLNQSGYVRYRPLPGLDDEGISVNRCTFALTAEGYEVANRLIEDKALE